MAKRAQTKKTATIKKTLSTKDMAGRRDEKIAAQHPKKSLNLKVLKLNKYAIIALVSLVSGCLFFSWPYWSITPFISFDQFKLKAQKAEPTTLLENKNYISNDQLTRERQQLKASLDLLMERMKAIELAVVEVKKLAQATTPPSEKSIDGPAFNNITDRLESLEENKINISELLKSIKQIKKNEIKRKKDQSEIYKKDKSQLKNETVYQKAVVSKNAAKLILALENLRQTMASNGPFKKQLNALKKIAGNNLNINTAVLLLSKNSASGIPNIRSLKQGFDKISGKIIQASRYNNNSDWTSRILNRLASIAVWRRIDGKGKKDSIDTIITTAELKLDSGDLKGAVSIVEGFSKNSAAAAIAKPWLINANNRIAADRALNSLHINAISNLTTIDKEK